MTLPDAPLGVPEPIGSVADIFQWWRREHGRHLNCLLSAERLLKMPTYAPDDMAAFIAFISVDFPHHVHDADAELFAMLLRRAKRGDEFREVVGGATRASDAQAEQLSTFLPVLQHYQAQARPLTDAGTALQALAPLLCEMRRYIHLENAVLLPLARLRLTPADWLQVRRSIAATQPHSAHA
jgi:iron-sulfur cluster repair protein YtfE (RIC family)